MTVGKTLHPGVTKDSLERARTMAPHVLGAWFEAKVKSVLDWMQENERVYSHRFDDTKAAATYLRSQPADFMASKEGRTYLLECKASAKSLTLRSCLSSNLSKSQAVHLFLWDRAQCPSRVLFLSVNEEYECGNVEVWDGAYISECRRQGNRLDPFQILAQFNATDELYDAIKFCLNPNSSGDAK